MYDGESAAIFSVAARTESNLSVVFGGKTSKERLGLFPVMISVIFISNSSEFFSILTHKNEIFKYYM